MTTLATDGHTMTYIPVGERRQDEHARNQKSETRRQRAEAGGLIVVGERVRLDWERLTNRPGLCIRVYEHPNYGRVCVVQLDCGLIVKAVAELVSRA